MDGYHCYGCDPNSPQGLRMEFYENGDEIVSVWHPRPEYQGWVNTLHGGIQATLADEISSWVVFRKFQTSGVTSKMEVRYHKPIHTTDDHIVLRASVRRQRRNIVEKMCIRDRNRLDDMIYVVGNEQNYHFQVLKLILKKLGYADWSDHITHLSYGMVELPEGKMKSREGTVVDEMCIRDRAADSRVLTDPAPVVWVAALADSSVNLSVRAWVKNADYWDVFFENNEKTYKLLPLKGISFPFPPMDVHVKQN